MKIKSVCVIGGTGFVGEHIVRRLNNLGYQVVVLTRRRETAKPLFLLPNVRVVECDVHDDGSLGNELQGCDAVINLVGILHASKTASFEKIHRDLARRVAEACRANHIPRLLHMSALNAAVDAPSAYLRSKGAGEVAVKAAAGDLLKVTIFQPSVIFGRGDSFLNLFAALARMLPVLVLAKPDARFQPVFVDDVADVFVDSLNMTETFGQTYPLCGPRTYSLRQLVQYVIDTLGLRRRIIGLNDRLSYLQAFFMELLPVKLMSRDNIDSMQVDSVCDCEFPAVFGRQPTAMEAVVPQYLADDCSRHSYLRFRSRAGR